MKHWLVIVTAGIAILASGLFAQEWWTETTQEDFADGIFSAAMYAAGTGVAGDGAVQLIHLWDIDKDGTLDLVVSNNRGGTQGAPTSPYYTYLYDDLVFVDSLFSYNGSANLIFDYDNDGNTDIFLSAFDDDVGNTDLDSRIYYGTGLDSASVTTLATNQAMGASTADVDNDGDLDVVVSNLTGFAYVYYQGEATPDSLVCARNYSNAIADIDDDGNLDIVLAGASAIIYYGPAFTSSDVIAGMDSLTDVTVADMNADSVLDLAFSAWGDTSYVVYGPDFAAFDKLMTFDSRSVSADNLDGDTDPDLLIAGLNSPAQIFHGPDFGMSPPTDLETHQAIGSLIGDFNGDRELDVCIHNWMNDTFYDTLSFIYFGPDYGTADSVACLGAHLGTNTDAGNLFDREDLDIYISSIYDGLDTIQWDSVLYTANVPTGSSLTLYVQTGNVPDPDTSWSDWLEVASGDTLPDSLASRYIRYRADFQTDRLQGPRLEEVRISYPSQMDVSAETILSPDPNDLPECDDKPLLFVVKNNGLQPATFPVHCILNRDGTPVLDSIQTVTDLAPDDSTMVFFENHNCCPGDSLWCITEMPGDVAPENDTLFAVLGMVSIEEHETRNVSLEVASEPGEIAITYSLDVPTRVELAVYDPSGRLVRVLDDAHREAGTYRITWDCLDETGKLVGAGVYLVYFRTSLHNLNRKIIILD